MANKNKRNKWLLTIGLLLPVAIAHSQETLSQQASLQETSLKETSLLETAAPEIKTVDKTATSNETSSTLLVDSNAESTSLVADSETAHLDSAPVSVDSSLNTDSTELLPTDYSNVEANVIHDLSPIGMYYAADWVVKSVMLMLVFASFVTWAIAFSKQLQLSKATKYARQAAQNLLEVDTLTKAGEIEDLKSMAGKSLLDGAVKEWQVSHQGQTSDDGIKERTQIRLERIQAHFSSEMAKGTSTLASVGSVGPFVGLFGTVWGIMNAFIGIAKSNTTSLSVVAPGIAEALLATAIGLVAAIPAVMMYNHFTRQIAQYRASLADISAAILILLSRDLDRKGKDDLTEDGLDVSPLQKVG